jgi:hypothetical protein
VFPGLDAQTKKKLCWNDVTSTGNLLSINQLFAKLGTRTPAAGYRILEGAFKMTKKMFSDPSKQSYTLETFLGKKFRGSKPVRKIITGAWIRSIKKKNANPY